MRCRGSAAGCVTKASASGYADAASTSAPTSEPTVYGHSSGLRMSAELVPERAAEDRQLEQRREPCAETRRRMRGPSAEPPTMVVTNA